MTSHGKINESSAVGPLGRIRTATVDDYVGLAPAFDEAELFHREALPQVFRKPETTFPSRSLYKSFVGNSDATVLIAEVEERLVGFVMVREGEMPDDPILVPRRFAVVDMLAVRKERRRMGLGRALMEAAHRWARERGIEVIELNVWEFNLHAIAFYEEIGYFTASRLMSRSLQSE